MGKHSGRCVEGPQRGATAPALLLLVTLASGTTSCADPLPDLQRVERSGFTMDLPAWALQKDRDSGGDGSYRVEQHDLLVEVGWFAQDEVDLEVLEVALEGLLRSLQDTEVFEQRVERMPDQLRLHSLIRFGGRIWIRSTHIACQASGLYVMVNTSGKPREAVESLQGRMLPSFRCRSSELPKLQTRWPTTDLPETFGVFMEGSPVLAHADGRIAAVSKLGPEVIASMRSDIERARANLASYAHAMGIDWSLHDSVAEGRNLSGPAWSWELLTSDDTRFVASVFTCHADTHGFIVFTADDSLASDFDQLKALSLRFGCPDVASPSLLDRPSACQVGAQDFCGPE